MSKGVYFGKTVELEVPAVTRFSPLGRRGQYTMQKEIYGSLEVRVLTTTEKNVLYLPYLISFSSS